MTLWNPIPVFPLCEVLMFMLGKHYLLILCFGAFKHTESACSVKHLKLKIVNSLPVHIEKRMLETLLEESIRPTMW